MARQTSLYSPKRLLLVDSWLMLLGRQQPSWCVQGYRALWVFGS